MLNNVSSFFFDDRGGIKYGDDNKDGHWTTTTTRTTKTNMATRRPLAEIFSNTQPRPNILDTDQIVC